MLSGYNQIIQKDVQQFQDNEKQEQGDLEVFLQAIPSFLLKHDIFFYTFTSCLILSILLTGDGGGLVIKLCLTLRPHGLSQPGSLVCGISQARIMAWVAISFSRGSSQPKDQTHIFYITGNLRHCRWTFFTTKPPGKPHVTYQLFDFDYVL